MNPVENKKIEYWKSQLLDTGKRNKMIILCVETVVEEKHMPIRLSVLKTKKNIELSLQIS